MPREHFVPYVRERWEARHRLVLALAWDVYPYGVERRTIHSSGYAHLLLSRRSMAGAIRSLEYAGLASTDVNRREGWDHVWLNPEVATAWALAEYDPWDQVWAAADEVVPNLVDEARQRRAAA